MILARGAGNRSKFITHAADGEFRHIHPGIPSSISAAGHGRR